MLSEFEFGSAPLASSSLISSTLSLFYGRHQGLTQISLGVDIGTTLNKKPCCREVSSPRCKIEGCSATIFSVDVGSCVQGSREGRNVAFLGRVMNGGCV